MGSNVVVEVCNMERNTRNQYLGGVFALVHLAAFTATVLYTVNSPNEQSSLIWVIWFPIDIPWSFLHFVGGESYSIWLDYMASKSMLFKYLFYTPYLVHGFIGTVWWYLLPTIISNLSALIRPNSR